MVLIKICNPKCSNPGQPHKSVLTPVFLSCKLICAHWGFMHVPKQMWWPRETKYTPWPQFYHVWAATEPPLACSPMFDGSTSVAFGNREAFKQGPGWKDGLKVLPQDFRNNRDRIRGAMPISLQPPTLLGECGWWHTLRRQNTGFKGIFKREQKPCHLLTCIWGLSIS